MRIYTDPNNPELYVNAISRLGDGTDVEGQLYGINAGSKNVDIEFQQGPVPENGVNGLTTEALLHVLIHRTKHLNSKVSCDENEFAIGYMMLALASLEARTLGRMERGVDGSMAE